MFCFFKFVITIFLVNFPTTNSLNRSFTMQFMNQVFFHVYILLTSVFSTFSNHGTPNNLSTTCNPKASRYSVQMTSKGSLIHTLSFHSKHASQRDTISCLFVLCMYRPLILFNLCTVMANFLLSCQRFQLFLIMEQKYSLFVTFSISSLFIVIFG